MRQLFTLAGLNHRAQAPSHLDSPAQSKYANTLVEYLRREHSHSPHAKGGLLG